MQNPYDIRICEQCPRFVRREMDTTHFDWKGQLSCLHPVAYTKTLEVQPGFRRGELTTMYSKNAPHRNIGYVNGKMLNRIRLGFAPPTDCSYILEHTVACEQDEVKVNEWLRHLAASRAEATVKFTAKKNGKSSAQD